MHHIGIMAPGLQITPDACCARYPQRGYSLLTRCQFSYQGALFIADQGVFYAIAISIAPDVIALAIANWHIPISGREMDQLHEIQTVIARLSLKHQTRHQNGTQNKYG